MNLFKGQETAVVEIRENEHEECYDCGAWIGKINPVKVTVLGERNRYYCGKCKKPYQEVLYSFSSYSPATYRAMLYVNEDGTPVGYVKEKINKKSV